MVGHRVVIVDDDPEFVAVVSEALVDAGPCQITQLGVEATTLDDLVAARPDLVFLDLRLGAHDQGWRLLQAARDDPSLANVPIVLCSADTAQLRAHAVAISGFGGVEVLEKPFSLVELESILQIVLPRAAARAVDSRTAG